MIKRICVFCGSRSGAKKEYEEAAVKLGKLLVKNKIGLVYGGGGVGLMGTVAKTVLKNGGEVIGVIPKGLAEKEQAVKALTDLRVVDSMHERKALMAELSDGFIALPGGLGTMEELFEAITWAQLGIHSKPCGLLNIEGYYSRLVEFIAYMNQERFVEAKHCSLLLVEEDPEVLLARFETCMV